MSAGPVQIAVLEDRGVVSVTGADAEEFLGGLITNDMALLEAERADGPPALYAALLSPQGKILFDFLVVRTADGFLLDVVRDKAGELVKRLSLYKLRAGWRSGRVGRLPRYGCLGASAGFDGQIVGAHVFRRSALCELRVLAEAHTAGAGGRDRRDYGCARRVSRPSHRTRRAGRGATSRSAIRFLARRCSTSCMACRSRLFRGAGIVAYATPRHGEKRVVAVNAEVPCRADAAGADGRRGDRAARPVAGARGLALLRLDRVADARRDGVPVTAADVALSVETPPFATFEIGSPHETA